MIDTINNKEEKASMTKGLDVLKEYKEIITVMVFFLAGSLWVFGYFATKDQLREMRCVTNANMEFLQGNMNSKTLSELLLKNMEHQAKLKRMPVTAPERHSLVRLDLAANDLNFKLAAATKLSSNAMSILKSGKCSQP